MIGLVRKDLAMVLWALILVILLVAVSAAVTAAPQNDLTIVGTTTRDGSSFSFAIEVGDPSAVSFQNVTWYLFSPVATNLTVKVDGNITDTVTVDGLAIYGAFYEEGRHNVVFTTDEGTSRMFNLNVKADVTASDWYELTGKHPPGADPGNPDLGVWAASLGFFLVPVPLVYRQIRRRKREEVERRV